GLVESLVGADEDERSLDLSHARRWHFQAVGFAASNGGQQAVEQGRLLAHVLPEIGQDPEGGPADVVLPPAFLAAPECARKAGPLVPREVPEVAFLPPGPEGVERKRPVLVPGRHGIVGARKRFCQPRPEGPRRDRSHGGQVAVFQERRVGTDAAVAYLVGEQVERAGADRLLTPGELTQPATDVLDTPQPIDCFVPDRG